MTQAWRCRTKRYLAGCTVVLGAGAALAILIVAFRRSWPAAHDVVAFGSEPDVVGMVARGVSPNLTSRDGVTLLHVAAERASSAVCLVLLSRGADPQALDGHMQTPLHRAAALGTAETCSVLREHGSDPDARDFRGLTALDLARRRRDTEVIRACSPPAGEAPQLGGR